MRSKDGEVGGIHGGGNEGRKEGGGGGGKVIEEPRPEGRPIAICAGGKSVNIERWMNCWCVREGSEGKESAHRQEAGADVSF